MSLLTTISQERHFLRLDTNRKIYLKHGHPKTYTTERIQIFSSFDFLPLL